MPASSFQTLTDTRAITVLDFTQRFYPTILNITLTTNSASRYVLRLPARDVTKYATDYSTKTMNTFERGEVTPPPKCIVRQSMTSIPDDRKIATSTFSRYPEFAGRYTHYCRSPSCRISRVSGHDDDQEVEDGMQGAGCRSFFTSFESINPSLYYLMSTCSCDNSCDRYTSHCDEE